MSFRFTCPHCGAVTDVADEFAGQSGPCVGCGKVVTVPPRRDTPGYVGAGGGGSGAWALIIVLVLIGGTLAMFCLGPITFMFMSPIRFGPGAGSIMGPAVVSMTPCADRLRAIGQAMEQYYVDHGSYPPAYIADENGKPMHSWRVLLLPYLGEKDVYDRYKFDEPWDGPNNQKLHAEIASIYRCEGAPHAPTDTNYVMVVGDGMLSDGTSKSKKSDITDPAWSTILIVETPNGIPWAEPRDLELDSNPFASGAAGQRGLNHPRRLNVLLADGTVKAVDSNVDDDPFKALLTIAGGEASDETPLFQPEN